MEDIFKWVVLGLILAGVAAAIRQFRLVNRERKAAIAEAERKRDELFRLVECARAVDRAPLRSVK